MKIRPYLVPAICSMLLLLPVLEAKAAKRIHFRGQVHSTDGQPMAGAHKVNFEFFRNSSLSGIPLWSETHTVVADAHGNYDLELGADTQQNPFKDSNVVYVTTETQTATAATVKTTTAITSIPQGIWLNCNPDNSAGSCSSGATINTETAIQAIGQAGFTYVLNASNFWGTQAQITAYANQANAWGTNIIWYLGPDFSQQLSSKSYSLLSNDTELASSFCSGCSNSAFVTALIKYLKAFPATAGYLIDDEQIQSAAGGYPISSAGKKAATKAGTELSALAKVIIAADSVNPILGTEDYASVPNASEAEIAAYYSYIPNGTLNYYGSDYYPVGALTNTPTNAQLTADQQTDGDWLDTVASSKNATGTFEDLQAYDWKDSWEGGCPTSNCAFPTVAQLEDMLTGATTSTTPPTKVFWWEYADVVYHNQWSNLLTAANPQ